MHAKCTHNTYVYIFTHICKIFSNTGAKNTSITSSNVVKIDVIKRIATYQAVYTGYTNE